VGGEGEGREKGEIALMGVGVPERSLGTIGGQLKINIHGARNRACKGGRGDKNKKGKAVTSGLKALL